MNDIGSSDAALLALQHLHGPGGRSHGETDQHLGRIGRGLLDREAGQEVGHGGLGRLDDVVQRTGRRLLVGRAASGPRGTGRGAGDRRCRPGVRASSRMASSSIDSRRRTAGRRGRVARRARAVRRSRGARRTSELRRGAGPRGCGSDRPRPSGTGRAPAGRGARGSRRWRRSPHVTGPRARRGWRPSGRGRCGTRAAVGPRRPRPAGRPGRSGRARRDRCPAAAPSTDTSISWRCSHS